MGKGDKKTRRGKIFMGSYGNTRPKSAAAKFVKPEQVQKVEKAEKPVKAEKAEKAPKAEKPKAKAKKE
jgi:30S ribosomal protein S31